MFINCTELAIPELPDSLNADLPSNMISSFLSSPEVSLIIVSTESLVLEIVMLPHPGTNSKSIFWFVGRVITSLFDSEESMVHVFGYLKMN